MSKYYSGTVAQLESIVAKAVSQKRFEHILRVRDYAIVLSKKYNVNSDQAEVAALVHDYAKDRSDSDFLKVIDAKHLDPDLKNWNNAIWHGVVGAEMIHDELGITDSEILDAVRQHTTGSDNMSLLSQILFMADYLEMGRHFPGVEEARALTDNNLQSGVKYQITHTLAYLASQSLPIHPLSLTTYNYWVKHA